MALITLFPTHGEIRSNQTSWQAFCKMPHTVSNFMHAILRHLFTQQIEPTFVSTPLGGFD